MAKNFSPILGVGLRPQHFQDLQDGSYQEIEWLEIISENYIDHRGHSFDIVKDLSSRYSLSCHGVSLSIGSPNGPDKIYLKKLKELYNDLNPKIISDHLCLTGVEHNSHDLLPIPFTYEMLRLVSKRVNEVQNYLERPLALENLSSYFKYAIDEFSEAQFMNELAAETGCKFLLDINNVYVSSTNEGVDPKKFLEIIEYRHVAQVHLAGFTDMGDFLFDTHSKPVYPEVWELFKKYCHNIAHVPTFIEWDDEIPEFEVLRGELAKASSILQESVK